MNNIPQLNIWGLFDSGNGCYKQAVTKYNSQNIGGVSSYNQHRY